ncbi:MAG: heme exporter protein CcmD [Neorhizobium sp.]|jgi:heme exporter protein D|nr:heme exporter protein CcmD [Neorhizobium sp.]
MSHVFYVTTAYLITAVITLGLIGWTWLDGYNRRKELATLEASGIRRRSAARPKQEKPAKTGDAA